VKRGDHPLAEIGFQGNSRPSVYREKKGRLGESSKPVTFQRSI
jgi:hypothetical protein